MGVSTNLLKGMVRAHTKVVQGRSVYVPAHRRIDHGTLPRARMSHNPSMAKTPEELASRFGPEADRFHLRDHEDKPLLVRRFGRGKKHAFAVHAADGTHVASLHVQTGPQGAQVTAGWTHDAHHGNGAHNALLRRLVSHHGTVTSPTSMHHDLHRSFNTMDDDHELSTERTEGGGGVRYRLQRKQATLFKGLRVRLSKAFADPFPGRTSTGPKLTLPELIRAIRLAVTQEQEAIATYSAQADASPDPDAARVLRGIADEERVHTGELIHLLKLLAGEGEHLREGETEAMGTLKVRIAKALLPLLKGRVKGHWRTTESGKMVWVADHQDKRTKKAPAPTTGQQRQLFDEAGPADAGRPQEAENNHFLSLPKEQALDQLGLMPQSLPGPFVPRDQAQQRKERVIGYVYDAAKAISQAHDLALIPNVTVAYDLRGEYDRAAASYDPDKRQISLFSEQGNSIIHEVGHAIDHALGGFAGWATGPAAKAPSRKTYMPHWQTTVLGHGKVPDGVAPILMPVMQAIANSDAMRRLCDGEGQPQHVPDEDWADIVKYRRLPGEAFARAYEQWVTRKNPRDDHVASGRAWASADFTEIESELKKLFSRPELRSALAKSLRGFFARLFLKGRVKGHWRTTDTGRMVWVSDYTDKRTKKPQQAHAGPQTSLFDERPAQPPKPAQLDLFGVPKAPAQPKPAPPPSTATGPDLVLTVQTAKPTPDAAQTRKQFRDTGEKIGGARKDIQAARKRFEDELTASALADLEQQDPDAAGRVVTRNKIWPKPNIAAWQDEGRDARWIALARVTYDAIGARPTTDTPEGRRAYFEGVQVVHELVESSADYKDLGDKLKDLSVTLRDVSRSLRGGTYHSGAPVVATEYQKAIAAQLLSMGKFSDWLNSRSRVKGNGLSGWMYNLNQIWPRHPEDKQWRAIEQWWPSEPRKRTTGGKPEDKWRPSAPAEYERLGNPPPIEVRDASVFIDTFGVRGVEFGNWMDDAASSVHVNRCAEAFADLADGLGLDRRQVSINGRLALAFGARGGGNFLAHYEPGKVVINLTKLGGAGSLAHEWAHFLDHMIGKLELGMPAGHATEMGMGPVMPDDPPVVAALRRVMNAIYTGRVDGTWQWSEFFEVSKKRGEYWRKPWELFARAFECYVVDALAEKGRGNNYLAYDKSLKSPKAPYPRDKEREALKEAFDGLIEAIRQTGTLKKALRLLG